MPAVCDLADRQQVSLGVLFTLVAFHLGLKSMDVYPKVQYIMFIDQVFLINMFVMALCVMLNGVSYALHTTCDEKRDVKTRSTVDFILLGFIIGIWILLNVVIFWSVVPSWMKQLTGGTRTTNEKGSELKQVLSHTFSRRKNTVHNSVE